MNGWTGPNLCRHSLSTPRIKPVASSLERPPSSSHPGVHHLNKTMATSTVFQGCFLFAVLLLNIATALPVGSNHVDTSGHSAGPYFGCPPRFSGYICLTCYPTGCNRACSKTDLCTGPLDKNCICHPMQSGNILRMQQEIKNPNSVRKAVDIEVANRSFGCPERFYGWACLRCNASGCQRFCSKTFACTGPNDPTCVCEAVRGGVIL